MKRCRCGRTIGIFEEYCSHCKKNLSLKEKVLEGLRRDRMFDSSNLKIPSKDGFDTSDVNRWRDN